MIGTRLALNRMKHKKEYQKPQNQKTYIIFEKRSSLVHVNSIFLCLNRGENPLTPYLMQSLNLIDPILGTGWQICSFGKASIAV